jgi:hypothetical protein
MASHHIELQVDTTENMLYNPHFDAMVLSGLVPWERGHPGRWRDGVGAGPSGPFPSRRDACAPRKNHVRIAVQVLSALQIWSRKPLTGGSEGSASSERPVRTERG